MGKQTSARYATPISGDSRRSYGAELFPDNNITRTPLMPNRQLSPEELVLANELLAEVRAKLETLSSGDNDLRFALRRKVYKELTYDERSKPTVRRKLKDHKWKEQRGLCALCGKELPTKYTVLDRFNAADGYTSENTRLIHQECDVSHQASKGYA